MKHSAVFSFINPQTNLARRRFVNIIISNKAGRRLKDLLLRTMVKKSSAAAEAADEGGIRGHSRNSSGRGT